EIRQNAPTEYSKIQNNVYRFTIHETGEKRNILRQLKIRTNKDYLNADQSYVATIDQLALSYPDYQLI
ncbi:14452_t:CDS:1, partial [Gigaspora rosea]